MQPEQNQPDNNKTDDKTVATQPAADQTTDNKQPQEQSTKALPAKGYNKRPMWQWVLIYIVIAAVVYFLVYYLFFHKGSGGSGY